MRSIRLQLACAAVLSVAWSISAATEMSVVTPAGSARVACIERGGVQYAPLRELAGAFQKQPHSSGAAEAVIGEYIIECAAGNPFVKVTRGEHESHLYQFSFAPFKEGGVLYVPAAQFVDILILATPFDITFDRRNFTVNFSAERPATQRAVKISSVSVEGKSNGYVINIAFEGGTPATIEARRSAERQIGVTMPPFTFDTANVSYASADLKDEITFDSAGEGAMFFSLAGEPGGVSGIRKKNAFTVLIRAKRNALSPAKKAARDRWKLDVIVLDAGHGGKDPGAQGVYGTNEKDVALGVVLKLGKMLEEAGFKVVYTRKTDTFVELYRRGEIANEAGGKLFICIHCNSMPAKPNPANGIESYILRPGKTESAARVAAQENNVVKLETDKSHYKNMTEESFIVASMAQSSFVRWSERFAALVQQDVTKIVPALKNNGVSQAGFIVLIGASMPNILIETGYISNPKEEKFLASKGGQAKLAEGVFNAVEQYKKEYERAIAQ